MPKLNRFLSGQHVALEGAPSGVTLTKRTGQIVRQDEWEGYYIVRLDAPAFYTDASGKREALSELREAADNLHLIDQP